MRIRGIAAGSVALIAAAAASTATIDSIDVDHDDGVYSLHAETTLAASADSIRAVLTDYERFGRISSVYKEYGYLDPQPDGTPTVFTRMEGCLMKIFCMSMTRVERLEINQPNHIRTVTLPEQSDFKHSTSEWFIEEDESGTHMVYILEMEPDFHVPPLIGPWYLKRTLMRGGGAAVDRIERLALAADGVEPPDADGIAPLAAQGTAPPAAEGAGRLAAEGIGQGD